LVKRYIVDIDGTICSKSGPDYELAEPIQSRIQQLNVLYDQGHEVVYFTARGMGRSGGNTHFAYREFYELTKSQLDSWGVKYTDLILGKPAGDVYIDDKAVSDEDFFNMKHLGIQSFG
jgi:capsule biosynthesis phosphatase